MKRIILHLILSTLLFVSCSNDDNVLSIGEQSQGDTISFNISFADTDYPILKAVTDKDFKTTWENGDEIGIFAVKNGESLAATGNFIHNVKLTRQNDGTWKTDVGSEIYYPNNGNALSFYAYYPYSSSITDPTNYTFSVKANQSAETDYNKSDLLLAKVTNQSKGTSVNLQFSHALSLVQVEVKREVNVPHFVDADFTVTLTGVQTSNTLNWDNNMVATGTSSTVTMHKVAGAAYTYRALVPAQTLGAESKVRFVQTTTDKEIDMEYQGLKLATLAASVARKHSVTLGWGIDPNHVYAVGDVYPHVGPAVGIVVGIENNGKNGLVLGLQEKSYLAWSNSFVITNAISDTNGRENMRKIYNLNNDFSDYPAFAWVHSMNNTNEDYSNPSATDVWYLPTINEFGNSQTGLYLFFNNDRTAFNKKITAAGGIGLGNYNYWTSQENNNESANFIDFTDGSITITPKANPNSSYRARCFLSF